MQTIIRRFPLYIIVSLVVGIPLIIGIILAIQDIVELNHKSRTALQDEQLVKLVIHYDDLAHSLAVERGLTAGVLGSKGDPQIVKNLQNQRNKVDNAVNDLQNFSSELLDSLSTQRLAKDVFYQLTQLNRVRSGVDKLAPEIPPFNYYSNLNQLIIDNVGILISRSENSELSTLSQSVRQVRRSTECSTTYDICQHQRLYPVGRRSKACG
uniref:nitrate- and nitrite sensing domain-containing protein n=1 Tax=Vibrio taketomensis TaxID=2572923 RepID=UPI002F9631EE